MGRGEAGQVQAQASAGKQPAVGGQGGGVWLTAQPEDSFMESGRPLSTPTRVEDDACLHHVDAHHLGGVGLASRPLLVAAVPD